MKKFEQMAKLNLPEEESRVLSARAETLFASFRAAESINTESIEPMVSVLNRRDVLREDVSAQFITRDELLSNAPEQYNGYFQVPKTLE